MFHIFICSWVWGFTCQLLGVTSQCHLTSPVSYTDTFAKRDILYGRPPFHYKLSSGLSSRIFSTRHQLLKLSHIVSDMGRRGSRQSVAHCRWWVRTLRRASGRQVATCTSRHHLLFRHRQLASLSRLSLTCSHRYSGWKSVSTNSAERHTRRYLHSATTREPKMRIRFDSTRRFSSWFNWVVRATRLRPPTGPIIWTHARASRLDPVDIGACHRKIRRNVSQRR